MDELGEGDSLRACAGARSIYIQLKAIGSWLLAELCPFNILCSIQCTCL